MTTCPTAPSGAQRIPQATPETVVEVVNRLTQAMNSFLFGGIALTVDTQGRVRDPDYGSIGSGAMGFTVVAKTANYTAAASDFVLCDTSGGSFAITLPLAASNSGKMIIIFHDYLLSPMTLTVNTSGSDNVLQGGIPTATFTRNTGIGNMYVSDGVDQWLSIP